jgi:glycosyltransferase involved in cell wall biosynthesis
MTRPLHTPPPAAAPSAIRVGFTEAHGMAAETSRFPPAGVQYSFVRPQPPPSIRLIRSPIKGYLGRYESDQHDLIEAIMSPAATDNRWILSCANFQEVTAFSLFEWPVPRSLRVAYISSVLLRDNCKKLIFWSNAGRATLQTYAGVRDEALLNKATVVYPAVRLVPDTLINFADSDVTILFSGDFFRKGGVNVIDAFERAQRRYSSLKLLLCCDEKIDFTTPNEPLRKEYLEKIRRNDGIVKLGRVPRDRLVAEILPKTDIYLLPTYAEAFGMSVLEAMAFGIPVIATNYFAIPEMLEHDVSGLLIDISRFDCDRMFRGYVVDDIPVTFREYVTEQLFTSLCRLIASADERRRLGLAALRVARTRFSFGERNQKMLEIYRQALR